MPFGDRTGPLGLGPMTGRAMGYCAGYAVPGFMNPWPGFGRGRGFWGRGRGWRRFAFVAPAAVTPVYQQPYQLTKEEELRMLENEAKAIEEEQKLLKQELESIKKQINELKK